MPAPQLHRRGRPRQRVREEGGEQEPDVQLRFQGVERVEHPDRAGLAKHPPRHVIQNPENERDDRQRRAQQEREPANAWRGANGRRHELAW